MGGGGGRGEIVTFSFSVKHKVHVDLYFFLSLLFSQLSVKSKETSN